MRINGTLDRFPKEEINLIIKSQIGREYTSEIVNEGGEKQLFLKIVISKNHLNLL